MSSGDLRWRHSRGWYLHSRREQAEIERCILFDALAGRQLARIPAAAQCLDQGGARDQTALADVEGGLGVGECRLLGDDDARIDDGADQILVVDDPLGSKAAATALSWASAC